MRLLRLIPQFLVLCAAGWALVAAAQAPEPSPSATPAAPPAADASPSPAPAAEASPAPGAPAAASAPPAKPAPTCSLEEPCVRADRSGGEKGRFWFSGFVDLHAGEIRLQADDVTIDSAQQDGRQTRILTATGNVVFLREEERMAGDKLTYDLGTSKGTFEQAAGFLDPGVFVEGRSIERLSPDTYRVRGGRFTSCSQPNPRWSFTASSATIRLDKKITASNVLFRVKGVPAFYIPYFVYPIRADQRSTGILFPHFGFSSLKGFNVGTGFFWAMGRSLDQTFYADQYSRFGYGFGHEFRYVGNGASRGQFRSYFFPPQKGSSEWDYDLDWNGVHQFPGGIRASGTVRQYSNLAFQRRFQDNLTLASTRTRRSLLNVQKSFGSTVFQATADATDTFFGVDSKRVNRRLPSLRLSRNSQRLGRTGIVVGYTAQADYLQRGDQTQVDSYSRFDFAPEVSRPFGSSFLQVNPRVAYRYTRYGASVENGAAVGPALGRRYFEAEMELRGPTFSKIFTTPGNFYSDKFKHVIGPEVTWRYRTKVDEFDAIPSFDGLDQYLGTNQVEYALVQRFLARRPGPSGKAIPYEFLTWSVSQTYYVDIAQGQNEFDPNYSSTSFGPGGLPDHNSAIQSRLRFKPSPALSTNFDLEYDINFKQLRTLSLAGNLRLARLNLNASWSRALRLNADAARRTPTRNTLRGSTRVELVPGRLSLDGSADYDFVAKNLVQSRVRARYDVQCCGFVVEAIQYDFNQRTERQFRFSIELANIGAIGNFMGADDLELRRAGLAGYR